MRMLKNVKRMIATVLSVTTCLTPGLGVSAAGGIDKAITIQTGSSNINQLPLVYNDDYFDKSAFEYNESLATASLALELSGFADRSDYSNQAKNAKKALGDLGFGDIQENEGYQQKSEADSIGVVVANKQIKSKNKENKKDEDYTLIPVVIRGGGYENEWGGNAKVGTSGDHEGFDTAATKAKEFVDKYITEKKIEGKVKLWIVGYSRGGATAGLLGVKFNRDFISTLNELNNDSEDPAEYYNSYVEKERARTLEKYGSKIEMNPNDLYVYTFEAPMGMNIANGSGLYEYKGNIPYSKLEKSERAIYENIHNTINDDDFVTKVAPRIWGFARPGVDHKLLEGRKDTDVKNTEEVLNRFLVNQAYPGSIKYVGNTLLKKSQSWKNKIFNWKRTVSDYLTGIEDFSALGDGIIGVLDRALNRARRWENDPKYKNMNTREYYADRYQATISKLAVAIMSDLNKAKSVLKSKREDFKTIKTALTFNTNEVDKPFNNLIDEFSNKMKVDFDAQERKNLINLIKGADQYVESGLLLYLISHEAAIFKMHKPEVHLATLISKDKKNKDLYDAQIQKINADQIQKKKDDVSGFVNVEKDELEKDKKDEKKDAFSDYVNVEKDDVEKLEEEDLSDYVIVEKDDVEKLEEEDLSGFVNVKEDMFEDIFKQGMTEYGVNRALAFKDEMEELKKSTSKNIFLKGLGEFGKGLKSVGRGVGSTAVLAYRGGKAAVKLTKQGFEIGVDLSKKGFEIGVDLSKKGFEIGVDLSKKGFEKTKEVVNGTVNVGTTVVKSLYDGAKYGFQLIGFGSKKNK